jgi:hypothetical protein
VRPEIGPETLHRPRQRSALRFLNAMRSCETPHWPKGSILPRPPRTRCAESEAAEGDRSGHAGIIKQIGPSRATRFQRESRRPVRCRGGSSARSWATAVSAVGTSHDLPSGDRIAA